MEQRPGEGCKEESGGWWMKVEVRVDNDGGGKGGGRGKIGREGGQ